MMKMAGALLIVGMTSLWGIIEAAKVRSQLENMKYLQRIISLIQSEIRYSRTFLGEIFWNIGIGVKEPYKSWLLEMSERTKTFAGDSMEEIWKEGICRNLKELNLPKQETESLKSLGNQLGYADVQVQMKLLDLYQDHLERTVREMHEQMHTKVRLYHGLGIMSGLFVTVLLL